MDNDTTKFAGIYMFGFFSGIAFSYSGLVGFITGTVTGLVIASTFPTHISPELITENIKRIFNYTRF